MLRPTSLFLYLGVVVPGSSSVTSSGPLSPFGMYEGNLGNFPFYLPFGNTGDEIDLGVNLYTVTPWVAPSFGGASLYGCRTTSCITDFVPPDQNTGASAYYYPNIRGAAAQVTVTAVPEEGALGLLSFCLMGLALWQWKQRGRALA
jgi:hypothetical protein